VTLRVGTGPTGSADGVSLRVGTGATGSADGATLLRVTAEGAGAASDSLEQPAVPTVIMVNAATPAITLERARRGRLLVIGVTSRLRILTQTGSSPTPQV
jgi:TRAP-type uncharacterized transport system substrate-binding protein